MARPTRWGIVGAGRISHDFVMCVQMCPQMCPKEEHEVVAVVDRNTEDAQRFANKFAIRNVYSSNEEFAKDSEIEIAYIGTIHPFHYKQTKLMLNAGKNVLCEKPMTLNYKHTKELVDLAKNKDLFLMEGLSSRFFPVYVKLREELASGSIGNPMYLSTHFGYPVQGIQRCVEHKLGGGALMDLGVYGISMALQVFNDEPERIVASAEMQNGVDYSSAVTLYFKNKRVAQINSHTGVMTHNDANIAGDKGKVEVKQMWCPTQMIVNGEKHDFPLPTAPLETNFPNGQGMIYEVKSVRECLLKGLKENPLAPHSDSLRIIKILDEAKKQIRLVYDGDIL